MIRLNELVPLHYEDPETSIVAPVCLPWSDEAKKILPDLDSVTVTGWGKVTNLNINYSSSDRTLRKKKLKKFSMSDCGSDFQNENQICAGVVRGECIDLVLWRFVSSIFYCFCCLRSSPLESDKT